MDAAWEGLSNFLLELGEESAIWRVRDEVARLRDEHDRVVENDGATIRELAQENFELKLRLGLLVRLLISKGTITAEEYANLIAAFRSNVSASVAPPTNSAT